MSAFPARPRRTRAASSKSSADWPQPRESPQTRQIQKLDNRYYVNLAGVDSCGLLRDHLQNVGRRRGPDGGRVRVRRDVLPELEGPSATRLQFFLLHQLLDLLSVGFRSHRINREEVPAIAIDMDVKLANWKACF